MLKSVRQLSAASPSLHLSPAPSRSLRRCLRDTHAQRRIRSAMPPRRSARAAAVAERATSALAPLPLSVVLHIFSLLPVDCRLRCAEVCRGWRAVLLERSLWTRLDLTAASGVDLRGRTSCDALLLCAATRAGGTLQWLQVDSGFTYTTLLDVAAANAGALRELHLRCDLGLCPQH
jgi:hypothetical protein